MLKNRKNLPLVLVLGAAVAVTSVVAYGNRGVGPSSSPAESESVQLSADKLAVEKVAVLAAGGRAAMSYIAAAQQGIEATDTELARRYLEAARNVLQQMQDAVSEAGSETSGMVPIFAQVGLTQDVEVTDELKAQLEGLAPDVMKGEHQKVIDGLRATGIGSAYTYVEMPLTGTIVQVDTALAALDSGKADEASQAISAANEGLVTDTLIVGINGRSAQELASES